MTPPLRDRVGLTKTHTHTFLNLFGYSVENFRMGSNCESDSSSRELDREKDVGGRG